MAELRQMRERISLIEAKLARSKQAAVHPSSGHSSPVTQTTNDSLANQLCISQADNVGQNSSQINRSVLHPSSTVGTSCSSHTSLVSAPKAQVSAKTGIIIFLLVLVLF